jgi:hypothetical protein
MTANATRSLDQYMTRALLWTAGERLRVWSEDVDAGREVVQHARLKGSTVPPAILSASAHLGNARVVCLAYRIQKA